MNIKNINMLRKSYALFPSEVATIRVKRKGWLSSLFRGLAYEREWAGVVA